MRIHEMAVGRMGKRSFWNMTALTKFSNGLGRDLLTGLQTLECITCMLVTLSAEGYRDNI